MDFQPYVLEVLTSDSWQTGAEIAVIVAEKASEKNDWGAMSFLFSFFSKKLAVRWLTFRASAQIYPNLNSLVKDGLVRYRYRYQDPDSELSKRGLRQLEYQLRQSGYREPKTDTSLARIQA